MKALVISGGGSKGAFAGGVSEYLLKNAGKDYNLFVGSSTGSLLVPFLAIGEIDRIKKLYTTIVQSDIFTVCPFIIKRKDGKVKLRINHFGVIMQFIKRQKTLGDSSALRKLIRENFLEEDFRSIKAKNKEVVVTVANLTNQTIEYKSSNDCCYDEFCDWMWASCNLSPLMSLFCKDGKDYADGGFGNLIPVQEAIIKGVTEIDTIVLRQEKADYNNPPLQNAIEIFARTSDFMLGQIANDDLIISKLETASRNVKISFYYIDRELTAHSFVFDKEEMTAWWQEGLELFNRLHCKTHLLESK
ncbi:patatin-like phospholipase family protein [Pedobacter aquatilis]|uniref:patatin-like phospholipase family protein n=1 Tax=Pedobacter aquatilis TaxID=351343 RepID=UPI00293029BC|nr:patatin-like phospholipase family protein [Pedobacter aquatilis]